MSKEKFFIYARKSTDRGDNQIESLPDQIKFLRRIAQEKGLNVVDIIQEAKSAKKPYNRPKFTEMITRIQAGEANGIICWKLDRLARNPIDAGTISWSLQEGIIKRIVTFEKEYLPEDNVLMMSVEMGMANQYSKDLSTNVSRSVVSKFEKGEYPSRAPIGYMNVRESKKKAYIQNDPERFDLVRKMWDLMLTGAYNPQQICDIANKEWGLKTRPRGKFVSKNLSYSHIYKLFTNIFYAGYLEYRGTQYEAAHEAMVTLEEFDRVQKLLGARGKTRAQTNEFSYTGIIPCSECGCSITAEIKTKAIKSIGQTKKYTYYHCTHRKKDYHCNQRKNTSVEKLEEQIIERLDETQMFPEFYEFAKNKLKRINEEEFKEKKLITKSLQEEVLKCDEKLERLLDSKIEGLIDSVKYVEKKEEISRQKALVSEKLDVAEKKIIDWSDLLGRAVDYVMFAKLTIEQGTPKERRETLLSIGKNLSMENGILSVGDLFWRKPFVEIAKSYKQKNARLEPAFSRSGIEERDTNNSLEQDWWTRQDSNLRHPRCKRGALPTELRAQYVVLDQVIIYYI